MGPSFKQSHDWPGRVPASHDFRRVYPPVGWPPMNRLDATDPMDWVYIYIIYIEQTKIQWCLFQDMQLLIYSTNLDINIRQKVPKFIQTECPQLIESSLDFVVFVVDIPGCRLIPSTEMILGAPRPLTLVKNGFPMVLDSPLWLSNVAMENHHV